MPEPEKEHEAALEPEKERKGENGSASGVEKEHKEHKGENDSAPELEKRHEENHDNTLQQVVGAGEPRDDMEDNEMQSFRTRSGRQVIESRTIREVGKYQEEVTRANNFICAKRRLKQDWKDFETRNPPSYVGCSGSRC